MANLDETMALLAAAGSEQTRKTYLRHGCQPPLFGVSYATFEKLSRQIGRDLELARELWSTGNHDARILATMVANPDSISPKLLNTWIKEVDSSALADALAKLTARSPFALKKGIQWATNTRDLIGATGWTVCALIALDPEERDDDEFLQWLEYLEEQIAQRPNRSRYAMNQCLIAIGGRNQRLRHAAKQAAKRIGPVSVDHGDTNCKTPDADDSINRIWERREAVQRSRSESSGDSASPPRPRRKTS